jgi:L,D-transpeptidase catalytic domain
VAVQIARQLILTLFTLAIFPLRALSEDMPLPPSAIADKVLVLKADRKLLLLKGDEVLKTYTVALGIHPLSHKYKQGDGRTPEGNYVLDRHNPHSQFYKSIHISYPNSMTPSRKPIHLSSPRIHPKPRNLYERVGLNG